MSVDLIFHSGRVFTGYARDEHATALAINDKTITAVGDDDQIRALNGPSTVTVDLAGRLIHPGFVDAHIHPGQAGLERITCDLSHADGAAATYQAITDYAAKTDAAWILGGGWTMSDFPGGTPSCTALDRIGAIGARPAFLTNRDHHGAWVNSAALRAAGIDSHTPDPVGGRIERDEHGTPTGTLHEAAMDLVGAVAPEASESDMTAAVSEAQRYLQTLGVTGWQDAILGDYAGARDATDAYGALSASGQLSARVGGALWWPRGVTSSEIPEIIDNLTVISRTTRCQNFVPIAVKIMIDGVAENQTAAMKSPYLCADEQRGLSHFEPGLLNEIVAAVDAAGFDVHMHAIGDRAVAQGLHAIDAARSHNPRSTGRHHIAHLQVIDPADIPRFAELQVAANAQTLWACRDEQMVDLTLPFLGQKRSQWQYPFASLAHAGARLVGGSDWPVSTPDPWQAAHVAVNRREPGNIQQEPLVASEALSLTQFLAGYTSGSAWINRQAFAGIIEPGAIADLAVASTDPFTINSSELHTVRNELTVIGGELTT